MFGVRRFLLAVKVAFRWNRALDKAAQGKHAEAMSCMKSIYDVYNTDMPSAAVPYDVNILCGSTACKLEDFDLSVAATIVALGQLEGDIKHLSDFDKDYLRYHCKVTLQYCVSRGKRIVMSPDLLPRELNYGSLQLEQVKSRIKREFPVMKPNENSASAILH